MTSTDSVHQLPPGTASYWLSNTKYQPLLCPILNHYTAPSPRNAQLSQLDLVWHGKAINGDAPEQVKDCMTEHTECISMEILRKEAKDTLDPQDPMVGMYSKKTAQENKHNKEEVQAEELRSRWTKRRILVNPDFVQGLDQDSGYVPYEEDLDQHEVWKQICLWQKFLLCSFVYCMKILYNLVIPSKWSDLLSIDFIDYTQFI